MYAAYISSMPTHVHTCVVCGHTQTLYEDTYTRLQAFRAPRTWRELWCAPRQRAFAPTAYVSIRQHTSAYISIRQQASRTRRKLWCAPRQRAVAPTAYVSIRQHTSAYASIRQRTSAYVSVRRVSVHPLLRARSTQMLN